MRRSRVLLWLALLAVVPGRSSGTVPFATPLAVRAGVEAARDHALPSAPLPWGERVRPGVAVMHAAAARGPAPELGGPRIAASPEPAPALPHGTAGALAYYPTGPPLLV